MQAEAPVARVGALKSVARYLMRFRTLVVTSVSALMAQLGSAPAGDLAIGYAQFIAGFNSYAQTNNHPDRMVLKSTDVEKRRTFKYVVGCVGVIGAARNKDETINEVFVDASSCPQREQAAVTMLLAKYVARLAARQSKPADAEQAVVKTFKALDKARNVQVVTIDNVNIHLELSDTLGPVVWTD
jgi:hypothetical protein